jgi:hypothetical protein
MVSLGVYPWDQKIRWTDKYKKDKAKFLGPAFSYGLYSFKNHLSMAR